MFLNWLAILVFLDFANTAPVTSRSSDPIGLVRASIDTIWNGNHTELVPEYFAEHCTDRSREIGSEVRDPSWVIQQVARCRALLPDLRIDIVDLFGDENRVVVRWTATGTFQGTFAGRKGDGRRIELDGITVVRVNGGKIDEFWNLIDRASLFRELGYSCVSPIAVAGSRGCIQGRAFDADRNKPLAYAKIEILSTNELAISRSDGRFTLRYVVPGSQALSASTIGYVKNTVEDIWVRPGETTAAEIRLKRGTCCPDVHYVLRHPPVHRFDPDRAPGDPAPEDDPGHRARSIGACLSEMRSEQADSCIQRYLTDDFVHRMPGAGAIRGRDAVARELSGLRSAFPDLVIYDRETLTSGDRVEMCWELMGTSSGVFDGVRGNGRSIRIPGASIATFRGDKIIETWTVFDRVSLTYQLGFVSVPNAERDRLPSPDR